MSRVMYDSVTVGEIPTDAEAVALYIDGNFKNWEEWTHKSNKLSVAVSPEHDAACLDVETGDATPAQAPAWVHRQLQRKQYKPVLYANRSTMPQVIAELNKAGIPRTSVRLWSAHYDGFAHICGPRSCGAPFVADGTQWTDKALGRNLDESLLADDFFPPKPVKKKRKPKPKPVHKKTLGAAAGSTVVLAILAALHGLGLVHLTPAENSAVTAFGGLVASWAAPAGYVAPKK